MKCLCCGKDITNNDNLSGWHKSCIKTFFGTTELPQINIDESILTEITNANIMKGYTVPGVQKKLSLHLVSDMASPRLTLVNYPTGYILKPQVERFLALPEAEHLVMHMAEMVGIKTVPHALIQDKGQYAYITKRIDRVSDNSGTIAALAMEDFCQLDWRLTQDKYKGSYEKCAKIITKYSAQPKLDMAELYIRIVFSYLIGNSDMHLKNFSLIEPEIGSRKYVLSAAYDLLPVNVVLPEDPDQFALTMNGKKRNIRRSDFTKFAAECGINKAAANKMIDNLLKHQPQLEKMCVESFMPDNMKENLIKLIQYRCAQLEKI